MSKKQGQNLTFWPARKMGRAHTLGVTQINTMRPITVQRIWAWLPAQFHFSLRGWQELHIIRLQMLMEREGLRRTALGCLGTPPCSVLIFLAQQRALRTWRYAICIRSANEALFQEIFQER
jgi:hypothetical protein